MTVKKLIEKLKEMPQNAEVFGYSHTDEGDHWITQVRLLSCENEDFVDACYCQGDSCVEYYIEEYNHGDQIVVLMDDCI